MIQYLICIFLCSALVAHNPRSIRALTDIQDLFLYNQKDTLVSFNLSSQASNAPIQTFSNFVPVVFTNNTGLSASQIYITFQGIDAANPNGQQFLTFDSNGMGSFVPLSTSSLSTDYSVNLANAETIQNMAGSYLFYVPLVTSGRAYVTFNQPLFLPVDASAGTVLDPFPTHYTDPNYYTIYDKWEFTFSSSGQTNQDYLDWQGNLNTSGVDFFGISSSIALRSYPSQELLEKFDPTQVNDGPTSFSQDRDTLITTFVNGLAMANNSAYWSALSLGFLSDPYTAGIPVNYLRILNPGFSIQFPPLSYGGAVPFYQNPAAGFPTDYLANVLYGENYIDSWFTYYNAATVPVSLLNFYLDTIATPVSYSGASGGSSPVQTFVFTGSPTEILTQPATTSTPFFVGTGFPFSPSSGAYVTNLSQFIGATFEVGLFDYTTISVISQANLRTNGANYYTNPAFTTTLGPWYDLYAKLLHSQGLIPSYSTTTLWGSVYASPYDDVLGINSSIAVKNPTDITLTPNPYFNIVLNGGNTNIPSIADSGSYMVTFNFPVASSTLSYREGGSGSYTPLTNGQTVTISSYPLQVQYVSGNYPGVTRYYTIYLNYQNIQPTITAGNLFNGQDQGILNSATIYPNSPTPTAFTVSLVQ